MAAGSSASESVPSESVPSWLTPLLTAVPSLRSEDLTPVKLPADGPGRAAAVLVLLAGSSAADGDILLLRRAATMRNHAGQIAFPGGATDDADATASATALRESAEEVGLRPETVEVLAELPTLYLPPSRFLVTPVLALWQRPHPVRAQDSGEVAGVARVPISALVDPRNRFTAQHRSGYAGPGFEVEDLFIWGFTAGLLSGLLRIAGFAQPWDDTVVRQVQPSEDPAETVIGD